MPASNRIPFREGGWVYIVYVLEARGKPGGIKPIPYGA